MIEPQPSKETIRNGPNRTPVVAGTASGPARTSKQVPHRFGADAAAQIAQGLRGRRRDLEPGAGQGRGQLAPDQPVADLGEQAHREQEVDPDPRRKVSQTELNTAGFVQEYINEVEWYDLGQLAQMPGSEPAEATVNSRETVVRPGGRGQ
nr:hypothetical protein [Streptomyces sp. BA2]